MVCEPDFFRLQTTGLALRNSSRLLLTERMSLSKKPISMSSSVRPLFVCAAKLLPRGASKKYLKMTL
jgi:hypothetical protein